MDYLDMLKDMASGGGDIDPQNARSVLNGARDRLSELEDKVQERLPDGEDAGQAGETAHVDGIPDELQKPKSEHDRQSRAAFYEAAREAGIDDPHAAWQALPDE